MLLATRVVPWDWQVTTWRNVRHELDRMHLVTMESVEGRVAQRSATTTGQAEILSALAIPEPGRFLDFELPTTPA